MSAELRRKYRDAAFHLACYNAGQICEALTLLKDIPEAGPIFAMIERADEMLSLAVQTLYHKAEGGSGFVEDNAAALMAIALPDALRRRLEWKPPK